MMGMVLGHIFNRATKKVPAWETRLCFSNPIVPALYNFAPHTRAKSPKFKNTQTMTGGREESQQRKTKKKKLRNPLFHSVQQRKLSNMEDV